MSFDLNIYSTPLLFGFVQGWLYAFLFWIRGWRQGRLSDWLFGCLLMACAFEVWEYMLGFAGINVLWEALNFFPRTFGILLPPLMYFYLKSQFNADFRFSVKDLRHALPFLVFITYHIGVFATGPDTVNWWITNVHEAFGLNYVEIALGIIVEFVYFYWAYQLYKEYSRWAPNQFSDTEPVSFVWFRNFLIVFWLNSVVSWGMTFVDMALHLDFWHDWWDELFEVALIYYLSIEGYAQKQPHTLRFSPAETAEGNEPPKTEKVSEADLERWKTRLAQLMDEEKPWLDPELALAPLSHRLGTNPSLLSAVINTAFGQNFNDYINSYRVEAVKQMLGDPKNSHYSLLGIGLECGFNSKSTFNRVFKKFTGVAPGAFDKA